MARPRVFDVEVAIETATDLFWRKGYERTSLADLTGAMGITPPSFYFAFGSKDGLFEKVLEHYRRTHLRFIQDALSQPSARGVAEHLLYGMADFFTDSSHPAGCLIVNCLLPCADDPGPVRRVLTALCERRLRRLRRRLPDAQARRDLPRGVSPNELARFILAVGWGMAFDAQAGASRAELRRTANVALLAWPTSAPSASVHGGQRRRRLGGAQQKSVSGSSGGKRSSGMS